MGPGRTADDDTAALLGDPLGQRRRAFMADRGRAHRLRALAAGRFLGVRPKEVRMACGRNGRPFLPDHPDVDVNLTHTGGAAAVGIAGRRRIGVDLESVRSLRRADDRMRGAFSPAEWERIGSSKSPDTELLALWTCKEALLKSIGVGLRVPLRDVLTNGVRCHGRLDIRPDPHLDPLGRRWSVWPVLALSGFVGAYAIDSDDDIPSPVVRVLDRSLPMTRAFNAAAASRR